MTSAIVDSSGNRWTLTSGGLVAKNGVADQSTGDVIQLAYVGGVLWQEVSDGEGGREREREKERGLTSVMLSECCDMARGKRGRETEGEDRASASFSLLFQNSDLLWWYSTGSGWAPLYGNLSVP